MEAPNIISCKDLNYLKDLFEWNYEAYKNILNNSSNVNDENIKNISEESVKLFDSNMKQILDILEEKCE